MGVYLYVKLGCVGEGVDGLVHRIPHQSTFSTDMMRIISCLGSAWLCGAGSGPACAGFIV